MSYMEAVSAGIPIEKDSYGHTCYYPPCHICNTPVRTWSFQSKCKYTCPDCRAELLNHHMKDAEIHNADKQRECLKRAIKRISNLTDIVKYASAIKWVSNNLGHSGWFQSTEEVMVALELIRLKIKAHHQVKIYNYRIDFILPDYKVALEIDGKLFHGKEKKEYEELRDETIRNKLGDGWEVIHIDTETINMNITRLMPAIRAVLKRRQRVKEVQHESGRIS